MRTNLPVTTVEYAISDDTLIVSRTETKGNLTYFNDQFVEAAGFSEAELMGRPQVGSRQVPEFDPGCTTMPDS